MVNILLLLIYVICGMVALGILMWMGEEEHDEYDIVSCCVLVVLWPIACILVVYSILSEGGRGH